jgi:DNA polymerase-3 subunit delta'
LPEALLAAQVKAARKCDDATAKLVAAMAGGSLARALAFDPEALRWRKELIERFEALQPTDARGWLELAEVLGEDRAKAEAALEVLQVWLRDVAAAQVGAGAIITSDVAPLAAEAARKVSAALIQRRAMLVEEARNAISQRNGAPRLQLERMFIEMFA